MRRPTACPRPGLVKLGRGDSRVVALGPVGSAAQHDPHRPDATPGQGTRQTSGASSGTVVPRSLVETAALFPELNRLPPESTLVPPLCEVHPGPRLPGLTDEELLCWQVAIYADVALRDGRPGQAEAALVRLEAEF